MSVGEKNTRYRNEDSTGSPSSTGNSRVTGNCSTSCEGGGGARDRATKDRKREVLLAEIKRLNGEITQQIESLVADPDTPTSLRAVFAGLASSGEKALGDR